MPHPLLTTFIELNREIAHLRGAYALLSWDQEVMMPEGAIDSRSNQTAQLAKILHEKQTNSPYEKALGACVDLATGKPHLEGLTHVEKRLLTDVHKDWYRATKLPSKFVEDLAFLVSQSQHYWQQARAESKFEIFAPYLEKLIEKSKEKVVLFGGFKTPYDGFLDEFEPDITAEEVRSIFTPLKKETLVILKEVLKNQTAPIAFNPGEFDEKNQWEFGLEILSKMGFDFKCGRLDKSTHPFTTNFHPTDVRITTRVNLQDPMDALSGTIHEGGHALYEQGLDPAWFGTPLGEATSLGIHESQSRLWENFVGKSRPFWEGHYSEFQRRFPEKLKGMSAQDFYTHINRVAPTLIRVEADELTYNLHIMIRFEIEDALFNQNLPVKDLPEKWNSMYQESLGITPPNDREGVLQDVHWSCGLFGYFPTYTLGNIYSRQFYNQAEKEIPNLEDKIRQGDFIPLKNWLNENIHRHGSGKSAKELVQDICGTPLSSVPLLDYFRKKFLA